MKRVRLRSEESGFALLMVFVMAAVIAITLYMEMPRVAFESQRAREQLLVDRGNEYKRGIQLYYRKLKRFPMRIEDLESTNNIRFLRRRYKDPLTGKDEWRLIHVGPGGFLTDSLVQKPNPLGKDQKDTLGGSSSPGNTPASSDQTANGQQTAPQLNANGTEGGGGINMATARRPSDQMTVAAPTGAGAGLQPLQTDSGQPTPPQFGGQPVQLSGQYPGQPQQPGQPQIAGQPAQYPAQYPGQPQQNPGQQYPVAGQPFGRGNPTFPGVIGQPGFPLQPGQPSQLPFSQGQPGSPQPYPPQAYPGQPLTGGQLPGNQFPGNQFPVNQAQGGFAPTSSFGAAQQNAAITAIQQSLFSPRQQPAGLGGTANSGAGVIGGIAGVASTYKGEGIKRVNEKKKYQEWEFVYDLKQDKTIMGNAAGQQMPQPQTGQGPGNTPFSPNTPTTPTAPNPIGITPATQR